MLSLVRCWAGRLAAAARPRPPSVPRRTGVVSLRTSAGRAAPLPPAVWMVLRPITKLAAVLFGRAYRKWWQALPRDKRAVFVASVRRNRRKIAGEDCVKEAGWKLSELNRS